MATDLERLTVLIEANTASYTRAMVRLQAQTEKAMRASAKSVDQLNSAFASMAAKAKALISIAAFRQLASSIIDTVHSAAGLVDLADKIGITTDALQELRFQAEQQGSSAEAMDAALEQFSRRVGEAAAGSGNLLKILKANNVELRDAEGNLRPLTQLLDDYADLIKNAADDQARAVLATQAFGKAGDEMGIALRGGAEGIHAAADEAHKLNNVMGGEGLRTLESYDDKLQELKGRWNVAWTEMTAFTLAALMKIGQAEHFILDPVIDTINRLRGAAVTDPNANNRINQAFDVAGENIPKITIHPKPQTTIPNLGGGGHARAAGRDAAADAAKREHDQVVELIAELQRELTLVGATDEQRRISNELHSAGAAATDKEKQQIIQLVSAIEAQEKAQDALIDTLDTLRDSAGSALDAFVQSIANSEGPLAAMKAALKDILQTIIQIAERQLITNLLGGFGTSALGGLHIPGLSLGSAGAGAQAVAVHVTASPLFEVKIAQSSRAAEGRAIARGPAHARDNQQRYAVP